MTNEVLREFLGVCQFIHRLFKAQSSSETNNDLIEVNFMILYDGVYY